MKQLLHRIIRFLKQPLWLNDNRKSVVFAATAIVVGVLALLQPFGISRAKGFDFFIQLVASGLGTFIGCSISMFLIPALFKNYYLNWTIGKEIIQNFITVISIGLMNGLVMFLLSVLYYGYSLSSFTNTFITLFIATIVLSPIPIIILHIWSYNTKLKANLEEAQELNSRIVRQPLEENITDDSKLITLSGITKESITTPVEDLLYLEAFGNYVKVFYRWEKTIKQKMLRATIKQMEDQLQDYPSVIRCHRAFLVNISLITGVKGNSQGYRLSFKYSDQEIPVSRAYTKQLKQELERASLI